MTTATATTPQERSTRPRPSMATWVRACRPRTLPLGLAPVVVGSALAGPALRPMVAVLAAVSAVALQVLSNLVNDLEDGLRGADDRRVGEPRAVGAGLVTPRQMRIAAILAATVAVGSGAALVGIGGWPIGVIGLSGLLAAVLYTAGPAPLGWLGLGEIVVAIFFGPVAVAGTHWLHTGRVDVDVVVAAMGLGLLAAAVLLVNNIRDRDGDARVGKKTLAVRFGRDAALSAYRACLVVGACAALALGSRLGVWAALPLVVLVPGHFLFAAVRREHGTALDRRLGQTAALAVLWSLAVVVGAVVRG